MSRQLPVFEAFIADLQQIWRSEADDAVRMNRAKPLLANLTRDPDLLLHSKNWPDTVGQNLLFFEDEDAGFVVNAVVRPPGY